MVMAAQALAGLTDQSPATQLAPMAQAAAPNPFMAALSQPEVFMALIGGGLQSMASGDVGQGFQTGMGTYQQLLQNRMAQESGEKEDERFAQQMGLEERRVAATEEGLELERERNKIAADAAKAKANKVEKKPPTGVDHDLWKQALDTATLELQPGEAVSESRVRNIYNTMAPADRQVPEMFGRKELSEVITLVQGNPDFQEDYLSLVEDQYGASARKRTESVLKRMSEATKEADEDEDTTTSPSVSTPRTAPAYSPATSPIGAAGYPMVAPSASNLPRPTIAPQSVVNPYSMLTR